MEGRTRPGTGITTKSEDRKTKPSVTLTKEARRKRRHLSLKLSSNCCVEQRGSRGRG